MKLPSRVTLKKYGISESEWVSMYVSQDGCCAICGQHPSTDRLNIDHNHVKNWKNLDPSERKMHIRQLLCYICNHRILTRGVTSDRLRKAADYLDKWKLPPDS
jgi:hypothetical protein